VGRDGEREGYKHYATTKGGKRRKGARKYGIKNKGKDCRKR